MSENMRSKALKGIGKVVLLDKKVRSEVEDPKDEFKLELNKNSEKPIPIFPNTRLILRRGKAHRQARFLAVAQEPSSPAAPTMKELVSIEEIFRQVQEKVEARQ